MVVSVALASKPKDGSVEMPAEPDGTPGDAQKYFLLERSQKPPTKFNLAQRRGGAEKKDFQAMFLGRPRRSAKGEKPCAGRQGFLECSCA